MKFKISKLNPNPFKKEINKGKLNPEIIKRIKGNIKELGLMGSIPIFKKDGRYYLIAGHHRLEALKQTFGNNFDVEVTLHNYSNENILRGMVVENLTQRADELMEVGDNLNAIRKFLTNSPVELVRDKKHQGERYQTGIKEIYNWLNKDGEVMSIGKISQYLKIHDNLDKELLAKAKSNLDKSEKDIVNVREAIYLSRLDKNIQKDMKKILDETKLDSDSKSKLVTEFKQAPEEIQKKVLEKKIDIKDLINKEKRIELLQLERTANDVVNDILSNLHNFKYNVDTLLKDTGRNQINIDDLRKDLANKALTTSGLHLKIFINFVNVLRQRGAKPNKEILELIRANGKI